MDLSRRASSGVEGHAFLSGGLLCNSKLQLTQSDHCEGAQYQIAGPEVDEQSMKKMGE